MQQKVLRWLLGSERRLLLLDLDWHQLAQAEKLLLLPDRREGEWIHLLDVTVLSRPLDLLSEWWCIQDQRLHWRVLHIGDWQMQWLIGVSKQCWCRGSIGGAACSCNVNC